MTGLSDLGFPPDSMSKWGEDRLTGSDGSANTDSGVGVFAGGDSWQFALQRYMGCWTAAVFALVAFLSPVAMVAIPQMDVLGMTERQLRCEVSEEIACMLSLPLHCI